MDPALVGPLVGTIPKAAAVGGAAPGLGFAGKCIAEVAAAAAGKKLPVAADQKGLFIATLDASVILKLFAAAAAASINGGNPGGKACGAPRATGGVGIPKGNAVGRLR